MSYEVRTWAELPVELQPADNELRSAWLVRVAQYDTDHPGVLTPLDAAGLNDWESRISDALTAEVEARVAADESVADYVSALAAAVALKQDAATAATDAELADEAAARLAADEDLADAVDAVVAGLAAEESARAAEDAALAAAVALKQDAASAATDVELAAEASARAAADAALSAAVNLKQDAATAATDAELAAEAAIRSAADATITTSLDAKADLVGGVVPTSQLPAQALTDVFVVADRPAMLALVAQPGDVAVVVVDVDTKRHTYILQASPASTFTNWVQMDGPAAPVSSVNGQIGIVVLGPSDVGAATPADVASAVATETGARIADVAAEASARSSAVSAEASARATADSTHAALTTGAHGGIVASTDPRLSDSRTPSGSASGDLAGSYPAPTIKASVSLSGNPTAATQSPGDSSTRIASTAYADAAVAVEAAARADAVTSLDGKQSSLLSAEESARIAADNLRAPLASPAFTGNPTVPTQTAGDNSTRIASTAYVDTACGLLVPKSVVTTKGDLLAASGNATVTRRSVGSNGQFLTPDSSQSSGLAWRDPADYGDSSWLPTNGIAQNLDRAKTEISAAVAMVDGTLRLFPGVTLRGGVTYSSIVFVNGPTAAGSGITHSWGGLVQKSNRSLLAVSADVTTATWAVNTPRTFTFSSAYTPTSDVDVYFSLVIAGTNTMSALLGISGGNALCGTSAGIGQISGTSNTGQTTPLTVGTTLSALSGGTSAATTTIAYAYLK